MIALSLIQPWATLIAIGAKRFETRSWSSAYRGELAIHASKWRTGNPKRPIINADVEDCLSLCFEEPFRSVLAAAGFYTPADLPSGAIVCASNLSGIHRTETLVNSGRVSELERAFGDFSPRRFGWQNDDVRRLIDPVPCRGAQGLWTIPPDIEALIRERLAA